MLSRQERRVHRLRLAAPNETQLRRGTLVVEDALHCASAAGINDGRLLIIRSLSIGRFTTNRGSGSLSAVIESRVLELSTKAVRATHPAAAHCAAVYFLDEIEPYIALALRIAQGQDTSAWFWSLAAPNCNRSLSGGDSLRVILCNRLQSPAGTAAAASLVHEMRKRDVLDQLLSSLQAQDGDKLLFLSGWSRPSALVAGGSTEWLDRQTIPKTSFEIVQRWVGLWGEGDVRSAWLAAILLIEEKQVRCADQNLMNRALSLIASIGAQTTLEASGGKRETARHWDEWNRDSADIVSNSRSPGESDVPAVSEADLVNGLVPSQIDKPGSVTSAKESPAETSTSEALETPTASNRDRLSGLIAPDLTQVTESGGLFYLIPLLSQLGMGGFLEINQHLIELDFPSRLLIYTCERLGISADEPILSAFSRPNEIPPGTVEYTMPAMWRRHIYKSGTLIIRRIRKPGYRIVTDRSGRVALSLWRGRLPRSVELLIGDSLIRKSEAIDCNSGIETPLETWYRAMRRWCRAYARLNLEDIVHRRGLVSSTPTHVDLFFSLRAADIRVRRAGLDVDPGWVAWLGRVVSFHYVEGDSIDGV